MVVLLVSACAGKQQTSIKAEQDIKVDEWLEYARLSKQNKNYRQAIADYQATLTVEPDNIEALTGIAQSYNALNMHDEALAHWRKISQLQPDNGQAMLELAILEIRYGRLDQAEALLTRAAEIQGDNWQILNAHGVIADLRGNYQLAAQYYQKALVTAPDRERANVCNNRGYSLLMSQDYPEAVKTLHLCLQINPYLDRTRNNLGLAYAWTGNYDEAYKIFSRILEPHQASNNVGYIAMLKKEYSIAEKYFNKAIDQSPSYYKKAFVNLTKLKALRRGE